MTDAKASAAAEKAWKRWSKQTFMPFVTTEERIRLAFLAAYTAAETLASAKEARKKKGARR